MHLAVQRSTRPLAALVALLLLAPLAGCGRSDQAPSSSAAPYGSVPPPSNTKPSGGGLSTGQKVAILAGTAALIYLYNKHKQSQGKGKEGQYYRSKNGRVYYRDAKGNAIWVTPPTEGIQVPQQEAELYNRAAQTNNWDVSGGPSTPVEPSGAAAGGPSGPPGPGRR